METVPCAKRINDWIPNCLLLSVRMVRIAELPLRYGLKFISELFDKTSDFE